MKNQTSIRLTLRDYDLLDALGDYRFLDTRQAATFDFPNLDAAGRRLGELVRAGLVHRLYMPVRPYDPHALSVFGLSAKGANELHAHRPDLPKRPFLSSSDRRSGLFLDHTLRRNDVRLALSRMLIPGIALMAWQQRKEEVAMKTTLPRNGRDERVTLIPDGLAVLRAHGTVHVFAIEIDMGTVRLPVMERRYRAYWKHWHEGAAAQRFPGAAYRVLTLTTTDAHLVTLRRAAARAPTRGRRGSPLFWFAKLMDTATPEGILAPVWSNAAPTPEIQMKLFKR